MEPIPNRNLISEFPILEITLATPLCPPAPLFLEIFKLPSGKVNSSWIRITFSEEQLKKTQKTLENYPPDLKEDELKFMDFDKNYYYFVEEEVINDKTYPFKVFSDKRLDQIALELCSINKIYDKKSEIYEYGCEVDLSVDFNNSEIFFCRNFT